MAKEILLSQGQVAIVDNQDYEWLSRWKWYAQRTPSGEFYAKRNAWDKVRFVSFKMHRVIMNAQPESEVDHVNGNKLDNQRSNLRICTHPQNVCNARIRKDNSCGYKGVHLEKRYGGKWFAIIGVNGKSKFLGYHPTSEAAARAYDLAAKQYHGEFAQLNLPTE